MELLEKIYCTEINKEFNDDYLLKLLEEFNFFNEDKINLNLEVNNKSLSSGQLQKISFMRSLLNDTKLLLLMNPHLI